MRAIKIYNPAHPLYPAVCECIRAKDLILTQTGSHSSDKTTIIIQDKNIEVWGTNAIIHYINDKYPHPPFFPNEPEKSAIIRMAIDEFNHKPVDKILPVYEANIPPRGFFSGDAPSILDLYLYALSPDTPAWRAFKNNFKHE